MCASAIFVIIGYMIGIYFSDEDVVKFHSVVADGDATKQDFQDVMQSYMDNRHMNNIYLSVMFYILSIFYINPFNKPNGDFLGFIELVEIIKPDQVTLVPDELHQITSDHGWSQGNHDEDLIDAITNIRNCSKDSKISLFIDDIEGVAYANRLNVELIEIHTGKFAKNISDGNEFIVDEVKNIVKSAQNMGILVNAGHDLNLENLKYLVMMGYINEVSIGHAIIVDSLHYGYEETIKKYLKIIRS